MRELLPILATLHPVFSRLKEHGCKIIAALCGNIAKPVLAFAALRDQLLSASHLKGGEYGHHFKTAD